MKKISNLLATVLLTGSTIISSTAHAQNKNPIEESMECIIPLEVRVKINSNLNPGKEIIVSGDLGTGVINGDKIYSVKHLSPTTIKDGQPNFGIIGFLGEYTEKEGAIHTEGHQLTPLKINKENDTVIYSRPLKLREGKCNKKEIMFKNELKTGQEVYFFDNPDGIGVNIHYINTNITNRNSSFTDPNRICMNGKISKGTSGSGVFDKKTHKLIGILNEYIEFGNTTVSCFTPMDFYKENKNKI